MKILVTGFNPFLGQTLNPSQRLATELENDFSANVESLILPVEFKTSSDYLFKNKTLNEYDHVLLIGQATGRSKVGFEKVALNWVQTEHRDEAGFRPNPGPIDPSAETALLSQFPIDNIVHYLKSKDLNVEISFSAGTFVCNELYFRCVQKHPKTSIVFIHVPMIEEQIRVKESNSYMKYDEIKFILNETIVKLIQN
jgi:pyroglutamyl-peptidase